MPVSKADAPADALADAKADDQALPRAALQAPPALPAATPAASASGAATAQAFIAADVGGTHARIALVRAAADAAGAPVEILVSRHYPCAKWPSLADILADFIVRLSRTPWAALPPQACVLACAGYLQDDYIVNYNLPWPLQISVTRERIGIARVAMINDFEALAQAVPYLQASQKDSLLDGAGPARGLASGPIVVMGPGTGLGCAVVLPDSPHPRVLPTEASHIALAPGTAREMEILGVLMREHPHVPVENALSGRGLLRLYRAISELNGSSPDIETPAEVTVQALAGASPAALEALNVFCALMGSFAADLAAMYRASGGVVLAGGILPQIREFLWQSEFRERFLRKGILRPFLDRVSVQLIEHGDLGIVGAACWWVNQAETSQERA